MSNQNSKPTMTADASYLSVFLSYGGPDEDIARRFYHSLREAGVDVFFFPEHATPGERLHRSMSDGVNAYDRVLLLCSASSLSRSGVLNELEQVLAREATEGGAELLIPIALDDYVFTGWSPERSDLARQVRDRVAVDFRSSLSNKSAFSRQFERLLGALETEKASQGRKLDAVVPRSPPSGLAAVEALQEKTHFLWSGLLELPPYREEVIEEMLESTVKSTRGDLEDLRQLGLLSYRVIKDRDATDSREAVYVCHVSNITPQLRNLIQLVAEQHATPMRL